MRVFETIKAAVTPRQAAETYGLRVLPNGMTCCPFHEDRHPSLKLNEDFFYCFGCGASGDVIDFTARLFGISLKDAAEKLAADFSINPRPPEQSEIPTAMQSQPGTGSGSAFVLCGNIFVIYASGSCGIVARNRVTPFIPALPRR